MLRSGVLESVVRHRVIGEGVESVVWSLDVVEEDSAILMLQDRLELLLRGLLLDALDGKILFAREMVLILPLVDSIEIVVFALGRVLDLVPPAASTSTLVPATDTTKFWTAKTVEFVQSVGRNTGMKHNVVPDVLRPLRRL